MGLYREVLGSYAVAPSTGIGHLPLVPSGDLVQKAAAEFYTRFCRLHFGEPLVNTGLPQADLYESPANYADWRPAFYDQVALTAFPSVETTDVSAFGCLHNLPQLEAFRDDMRARCHLNPDNVETAQEQLEELSYRMRQRAQAAAGTLVDSLETGRRKLYRAGATGALNVMITYVTSPIRAALSLFKEGSSVLSMKRDLDPTTRLAGTDLVLLTLAEGKAPGRC